ncbi:MAG: hypothetical protein WC975_06730 [Phycisphaerae bacterium]
MKKKLHDDLRSEYDFASLKMVGKGKYVRSYRAGTNMVLLSPDVAKVFPDAEAVNEALRLLIKITEKAGHKKSRKAI